MKCCSFCPWQATIGKFLTWIYILHDLTRRLQNKQCDVALNSAVNSKWLVSPSKNLSLDGQTLVKDLRDVIDTSKLLFLTKNAGELLQEFIWDAQHITGEDFAKISGPVDRDSARQDADKAAEGFRTLGTLLITNGEFRKLCKFSTRLLHVSRYSYPIAAL
jgi:Family of unknown function (DUF5923)